LGCGQLIEVYPAGPVYTQKVFRDGLQGAKQENYPVQAVPNFCGDLGLG